MLIVGSDGATTAIDQSQLEELMRTESEDLVRELAVEIWRTRRRFEKLSPDTHSGVHSIRDSIARLEDVLLQHDVRLNVHDGETYDPGLGIEVLEAQGPSDARQIVRETVRPTVLWHGRIICRAQVVVGPDDTDA
jgi:hypothetical protein